MTRLHTNDGRQSLFTYDSADDLVSVDNKVAARTYVYDDKHRIVSITDADATVLESMAYDDTNRVTVQRSHAGRVTEFSYDGLATHVASEGERQVTFSHDTPGRVVRLVAAGGHTLIREYDSAGELRFQQFADGTYFHRTIENTDAGVVERLTWDDGTEHVMTYDHLERVISNDWRGTTTRFEYGGFSLFPHAIAVGSQRIEFEWEFGSPSLIVDADNVVNRFEVGADGLMTSAADGFGNTTRYAHHVTGNLASTTDPLGFTKTCDFDDAGRLVHMTDQLGAECAFRYTHAGRLTEVTLPNSARIAISYDDRGLADSITGPDGSRTELTFDEDGRLVRSVLADATTISVELNPAGLPLSVDVDDTRAWSANRDGAGRVIEAIDGVGRTLWFAHLRHGLEVRDAFGTAHVESLDYDQRELRTADRGEGATKMAFSEHGQITEVSVDDVVVETLSYTPGGRLSERSGDTDRSFEYDRSGRVVRLFRDGNGWELTRDQRGLVTESLSPQGRRVEREYDPAGRCFAQIQGESRWEASYDPMGYLIAKTDPLGNHTEFRRDVCGRMEHVIFPNDTEVFYEYSPVGKLATIAGQLGRHRSFEFDLRGMTAGINGLGERITLVYNDAGDHVETRFVDGSIQSIGYDEIGRMTSITETNGNQVSLTLDERGDVVSAERTVAGVIQPLELRGETEPPEFELATDQDGLVTEFRLGEWSRRYLWDADGRIGSVEERIGETARAHLLKRDLAGRIVERVEQSDGMSKLFRYGYDSVGRLAHAQIEGDVVEWVYDVHGRLVSAVRPDGATGFSYNAAGQLVEVVSGSDLTRIEYDHRGRRLRETGAVTVEYVWDDSGLIKIVTGSNEAVLSYALDGGLVSIDGQRVDWCSSPVPRVGSGFADLFGDSPWGEHADGGHSVPVAHRFGGVCVGRYVWLGQRVYDIETRQFLSCDPVIAPQGSGHDLWDYGYAYGDPIDFVDPSGRSPISLEEMNRLADRYTGAQWGNIAYVVATVAVVAVAVVFPPAGIGGLIAMGAVAGGGPTLVKELVDEGAGTGDQGVDWGGVVKSSVTGALTAGVSAKVPFLNAAPTSRLMSAGQQAIQGGGQALLDETWDGAGLPGGDHSFDLSNVVIGTGTGFVGGGIGYRPKPQKPPTPTVETTPVPDMPEPKTPVRRNSAGRAIDERGRFIVDPEKPPKPTAANSVDKVEGSAFHHTTNQAVESITSKGLYPGSYATPVEGLSPLQAHIELALNPANGARNAVLEVDLVGLRSAGFEIPPVTRVTSRYGMPGGGYEMQFPYEIPPEFIKVIQR